MYGAARSSAHTTSNSPAITPASPSQASGCWRSPTTHTASTKAVTGSPSASVTPVVPEIWRSPLENNRYDSPVLTSPRNSTTPQAAAPACNGPPNTQATGTDSSAAPANTARLARAGPRRSTSGLFTRV